ncbi:hypothetical protein QT562_16605 [Xanthomonas citri pv. citri]|uniref:Uncharacterized protein n=1 Tax=Xanthomonas citri pv. durantae TaxID=487862 RepID=A0A9X9IEE7_XANCI|nr:MULTISPECIES: hypothetical protein [Xanthomonas]AJD66644.1 hypothetical protein J151_00172 [Xanthomonas citri subsp. citri A306]AJY80179.1 hypothetical protein J159_00170 [Xanthomonas citri pv. citri]AJY84601.1 hypothetical protein J158_00170 [Xanthomonas citri subsp. citri UI6]AJY89023.1 hypothetical protein J169_00168 [Xanthomonas citri pv. citri]AJY93495.1 hypothetical protein J164_00169 [Xanthomonas citri pv. citri]
MHENQPAVLSDTSIEGGRKAWSAPVVSFLSIDETASNATVGDDGNGTFTGS